MPTLNWLSREDDLKTAAKTEYRLLEDVQKYSYGDPDSGNLIVQGDNLEALKALLPFYAGQVKCIYIDPPYNTGSAFEQYDDNMEHTLWLSMMYPRLELLKQFLHKDGSIFIQLDDNEQAYAKVLCDEIKVLDCS
jgi:adenine-specific DNA-methyltransferase